MAVSTWLTSFVVSLVAYFFGPPCTAIGQTTAYLTFYIIACQTPFLILLHVRVFYV